jgi:hypothetical protein
MTAANNHNAAAVRRRLARDVSAEVHAVTIVPRSTCIEKRVRHRDRDSSRGDDDHDDQQVGKRMSHGERDAGEHRQQLFAQRFAPWSRIGKLPKHERQPPVGDEQCEGDERGRDNDAGESRHPGVARRQPSASDAFQISSGNGIHAGHGTAIGTSQDDDQPHE